MALLFPSQEYNILILLHYLRVESEPKEVGGNIEATLHGHIPLSPGKDYPICLPYNIDLLTSVKCSYYS